MCDNDYWIFFLMCSRQYFAFLQATGAELDREDEGDMLKGLLMVGHLNLDPEGRQLPWPIPAIGFGNGAHLAAADLRCRPKSPHGKDS